MKRLLLLAALFCVALFSAGCALVSSASSPPLVMVLCADTSDGSGVSAASMTSLVDSLLPELVGRRGTMVFWALDDVEGAVLVGRFVVGTPLR
jgi:MFS family permease